MTYEKQTFRDGQVLTAACLNRMEDGIKNACDSAPPACTATDCSKVLIHGENGLEWVDMPSSGSGSEITDYVKAEAEAVADKILAVRTADTFVMACASDLHTSGSDTSATSVLHAGQAMNEIQSLTQLDLVAILGDIQVGDFEENTTGSFKYVKKCFADVAKGVPYLHLQGNHDELPSDTTEKARQRYYAYIGANNVGTVTDYANKFRNYGYRDFDNYKVRVIYLNTADVSENEMTYDNNITAPQMEWFVTTALNLSGKDNASEWGVIVCGHHPLNWVASGNGSVTKVLDVLNAYKGRASGSVVVDGKSISYNFSGEMAEFICHIHGHLHNFREEVMGTNKVLSITVPNACFGRNNEYGNYNYATYPDVVKRYGDDGADNDGTKAQRTYTKTSGTAEDTAFSVFCIDRASKIVNVFNYGAGIDRQWNYAAGAKDEPILIEIQNHLTNCTTSNSATSVRLGDSYSATIIPDSGYELDSIDVFHAGDGWGVVGDTVTIPEVKGQIVITATARYIEVEPDVTTYSVTNNLTNCTSSNYAVSVEPDARYTAIIAPNSGFMLGHVDVVHAGNTIAMIDDFTPGEHYEVIIPRVEGEIVITAWAVVEVTGPTNQITESVNADGSQYVGHNGEDGYSVGYRVNSSGVEGLQEGMCCTGYIWYQGGQFMRLKNVTVSGTKTPYVALYNQDGSFLQVLAFDAVFTDSGNGVYTGSYAHTGPIRITIGVIDDTSILTLDEEIV